MIQCKVCKKTYDHAGWYHLELVGYSCIDGDTIESRNCTCGGTFSQLADDLDGLDLAGEDLAGADLTGACLAGADLSGADLTGARLVGANLTGANLAWSDLVRAILTGTCIARGEQ